MIFEIMKPSQLKRYSDEFLYELDTWLEEHVKPVNKEQARIYNQVLEHEIDMRISDMHDCEPDLMWQEGHNYD